MAVYIALLRGVNVGGHNKISMEDLEKLFGMLGFQNALTYIQSGNIVFESEGADPLEIAKTIKQGIKDTFSVDSDALVLSKEELSEIIAANPFDDASPEEGRKIFFTMLSEAPDGALVERLRKAESADMLKIVGRTLYLLCRHGYNKTAYSNNSIERMLDVKATSRNIKTMKKLEELAGLRGMN